MKPFQFSLQSLLALRQQKEASAQVQHAGALTAREQAAASLEQAAADLSRGMDLLAGQLARGETANQLLSTRAWCSELEARRNERKAALEEARRRAEKSRHELAGAARERETLDRFREKSFHDHAGAIRREEQQHFDEIAVQRREFAGPLQMKWHHA
jgi:flagellar FliJ protein